MLFINNDSNDVYFNFALEHYFVTEKQMNEPLLVFWRTEPTLMVGKYQNIYEEVDVNYAKQHNINIVRRPSGGGTIYTDLGSWQFTFIQYQMKREIFFDDFTQPVIVALNRLGVPAEFNGRNDIMIENKKISGNAQYKEKGITVHHGSLLFDTDIEEMVRSTTVDEYKIISKSIKSIRDRVTNIAEYLSNDFTAMDFKQYMVKELMGNEATIYHLTRTDIARINELADQLFRSWEAKYKRNPTFTRTTTHYLAGGKLSVSLNIKSGRIAELQLTGDFFSGEDIEEFCQKLVGTRLDEQAIREKITELTDQSLIYNISNEEIATAILDIPQRNID